MSIPNAAEERLVLAYYYIWFTKGYFDGTNSPNEKDSMSSVHPVIGPYDSDAPETIRAHMRQVNRAKIDALAVSFFYNLRNHVRRGRGANQNDILERVMTIGHEHGVRVCIDLEGASGKLEYIYAALRYYLGRYTNDPRALHADGKPVVLLWHTWTHGPKVWKGITDTLRKEGLEGFYVASNQMDPAYFTFLDALECYTPLSTTDTVMEQYTRARKAVDDYNRSSAGRKKPGRWHATVMPGFEDRILPGRTKRSDYVHYRLRNAGLYYWETFAAAMASRPEWLHVTSFNELAEHTYIEESEEYGDLYLRLTAEFASHFKAAVW